MARAKPSKARRRATTGRLTISDQLRAAIDGQGLTAYAVGQLADVDPGVVSRFLTGVRSLRLDTVDRIAAALGLRLVESTRGKTRSRRAVAPVADQVEPEIEEPASD